MSVAAQPLRCACKTVCGDVPEHADHPNAVCKMLKLPPKKPLVEVVLVHRGDVPRAG